MRLFSWGSMTAVAWALVLATPIVAQQIMPDRKAPTPAKFAERTPMAAPAVSRVSYPDRSLVPLAHQASIAEAEEQLDPQDE
jgi:hypothetical protein